MTRILTRDLAWDAKGDLVVGTSDDHADNLPVGANDTVPIADSGETTGIRWGNVKPTTSTVTTDTTMVVNTKYIVNKTAGGACAMTLPATASVGDFIELVGIGTEGWTIVQGAGQYIHVLDVSSTAGVGGSVSSDDYYASIIMECVVADTAWRVRNITDEVTVV